MVTTRPTIRLSGFSRKTSFDGPSLNSSSCSSFTCPNKRLVGSQQNLKKCECDCSSNPEVSSLFRQQQQLHQQLLIQKQQQRHHHIQQQQRNHHLLLLQLQHQKSFRNVKPPAQHHPLQIQKRPLYFPQPPLHFRPTVKDANTESDREGLEHFHRHLQRLHQLTCSSLENAIYFGGGPAAAVQEKPVPNPKSKLKHPKSFSFRDIRDIGKKKNKSSGIPLLQQPHPSSSVSPSSSQASSSTQPSTSSSSSSVLKRRNTTKTAKDFNGLGRIKLLSKYWSRGKSSGTDSGNGGSERASRSSESDDCQLSNCSSSRLTSPTPKTPVKNRKNGTALVKNHHQSAQNPSLSSSHSSSSNANTGSPCRPTGHKVYPISQNNISGSNNRGNTVTYKVRYDIPSSWESEQLLSFASQQNEHVGGTSHAQQREDQKHDKSSGGCSRSTNAIINRSKNKESSSSTCTSSSSGRGDSSVTSEDQEFPIDKEEKFCTHCGRGPEAEETLTSLRDCVTPTPQPQKSRKVNLFKNLTFIKPQSSKPKDYLSASTQNLDKKGKDFCTLIGVGEDKRNGKFKDKGKHCSLLRVVSNSTQNLVTPSASTLSLVSNPCKTMVQQQNIKSALGRSKSQKNPDKQTLLQNSPHKSLNSKLTHTNSLLVLPNKHPNNNNNVSSKCPLIPTKSSNQIYPTLSASSSSNNLSQPKVRFKEQKALPHYRSEQCLLSTDKSQSKLGKSTLFGKYTRRSSSSSTTVSPPVSKLVSGVAPNNTNGSNPAMLPDEREYHSLYDCRIPRPKLRGIVPTHSYGVCNGSSTSSGNTSPSSPVSCSSGFGGCNSENTIRNSGRMRRHAQGPHHPGGDFNLEFTEISLQDDDSETSGFESEQNTTSSIKTINNKDETLENEASFKRKQQQAQRTIPPEMTPAGKYFTDFKSLYHYQEQKLSTQKSPTPSRGLSFRKTQLPALLSRSGKKKGSEDSASVIEFLKALPMFRKLNDGIFAKLADNISEVSYNNGSYIFRQGEKGDAMYFLMAGTAKATFKSLEPGKSDEIFLKTLHPGDFFGERTFQTRNGQYTYNVISGSEDGVTCARLDREAYEELIYKCHEFKIRVLDRAQRKIKLPDDIVKVKLDDLRIVTTLGVGGFGRVELCTLAHDSTRAFALKKMKKCQIVATRQIEHIRSEKNILLETNCDFICKLYKTFKDSQYLYMLMECCLGGELWTVLRDRGRFEDETAKFYIGCVLEALKYLHTRNIIYRDLKPENLLLDSNGYVKLVDFGFAKKLDGRKTWTFCGTPEYCAPEIILNKGHDLSADFWSLGVLMYELLTGTPPFTGGDPLRTYKIILQGIDAIEFPPTIISKYAVNLIRKLCRDNPAERLGAQRGRISDIKKHKWFDGFDWHGLHDRTLTPPIIPDVRGPLDFGNFDEYPPDRTGSPPEDLSGWDWDF